MAWVVVGEEKGKIKLASKSNVQGLLPKGSYLTIESDNAKFILRVDDSRQEFPYAPSPMIVDMDLSPLEQDQKCQNVIYAYRVKDISNRTDGLIDFIRPQLPARRSTQDEIDVAMGAEEKGPRVFVATIYANQNQILKDENSTMITATLPISMFYHQMLICGKTGSGKTVATKYLAQYFVEHELGAVLAINVKDTDFLKMDKKSKAANGKILEEWKSIGEEPHKLRNFIVYHPSNTQIMASKGVSSEICRKVTLNVKEIEPEALTAILQNITDIAAQHLPNIFRFWREDVVPAHESGYYKFINFVNYFANGRQNRRYDLKNSRGEITQDLILSNGTIENIYRNLVDAAVFFDDESAISLHAEDVLIPGKMSVIDVAESNAIQFGSILLRHLLHKIVERNSSSNPIPILIIIDEVHKFYNSENSRDALGDLDYICRTGRSQKIGVIFSSQNPEDIPSGLLSVINTKIFFKTDTTMAKKMGIQISAEEMEGLMKGFAVASIHELSQLKTLKFPLAFAGVFEEDS